jgi:class 3 adenylate cyclase/tetratricopeptide (TPR) repeat protein
MRVCPNCGAENADHARFCQSCARPFGADRMTPAHEEERKLVTVLFCDQVGFTARADRADPEDVRAVLRPYHARLRQEIEHYGGTLEKFVGDAAMGVFGAPVAHEDDAERGVRAALAILEDVRELNEARPGLDLEVRVGLATGEVVVDLGARAAEGEGMIAGDVVNTASRLQQEAGRGTVIVDARTYRATKHVITYEELKPVRVKGKAERIPVMRVVRARSRFGVDVDQGPPTPFVGRQRELTLLRESYSRVIEDSGAQLVTIAGEPGVGKTRLLFELRQWIDDREELVWWRQGRCLPYGDGITFWALGEAIKSQARILESDVPSSVEAKLATAIDAVVEEPSEREWMRARLSPLVGLRPMETESGVAREEAFTAWRRFLEGLATIRPLVLLFEDVHWADSAMLEFIEHLVDWTSSVPILVLCSCRPELFERAPAWGGGKKNSTTITLSPLSSDDTARLIAALLSEAVLPAEIQTALLERSGGNPLYAEEFVRMVLDRGILKRRGRTLTVPAGADIPLPETIQSLIAARLDFLPPDRKSLLQDASVVGKVFWSGAVASMSGVEDGEVRLGLHDLARAELIRPVRESSIEGQDEYSFWHILVRDVAYGQIPRASRSRRHVAAARWIEGMAGERVGDHAEILSSHYTEALGLAKASGDEVLAGELRDPAIRSLILSGDRSIEFDVARAERYYGRALDLIPQSDPRRPPALVKVARAHEQIGRNDRAESALREAIDGYRTANDGLGAGEAMVHLADFLWGHGDPGASAALVEKAVEILEGERPGRGLAIGYLVKCRSLWRLRGREQQQVAMAERALSLARDLGFEDLHVRALDYLAMAHNDMGESRRAAEEGREALRLALSLGLGQEASRLYNNVAGILVDIDPAEGLAVFREGVAFDERRGADPTYTKSAIPWELLARGRWGEAESLAKEVAASTPDQVTRLDSKLVQAQIRLDRGDLSTAAALTDQVLSEVRKVAPRMFVIGTLPLAAVIESRRGNVNAARGLIEEVERMGGQIGLSHWGLLDTLYVLVTSADVDWARKLLDSTRPPRAPGGEHALVTARAIVAEGEGRLQEAAGLYDEAAARWAGFGYVRREGQALLGAGRCLVRLGRLEEATERLNQARRIFEPPGANLYVREIDELLERGTELSS